VCLPTSCKFYILANTIARTLSPKGQHDMLFFYTLCLPRSVCSFLLFFRFLPFFVSLFIKVENSRGKTNARVYVSLSIYIRPHIFVSLIASAGLAHPSISDNFSSRIRMRHENQECVCVSCMFFFCMRAPACFLFFYFCCRPRERHSVVFF